MSRPVCANCVEERWPLYAGFNKRGAPCRLCEDCYDPAGAALEQMRMHALRDDAPGASVLFHSDGCRRVGLR